MHSYGNKFPHQISFQNLIELLILTSYQMKGETKESKDEICFYGVLQEERTEKRSQQFLEEPCLLSIIDCHKLPLSLIKCQILFPNKNRLLSFSFPIPNPPSSFNLHTISHFTRRSFLSPPPSPKKISLDLL